MIFRSKAPNGHILLEAFFFVFSTLSQGCLCEHATLENGQCASVLVRSCSRGLNEELTQLNLILLKP